MIPNSNLLWKDDFSINGLLDALRKFNAKERFYLVGQFLGNPEFKPKEDRLADLEKLLKITEGTFVKAKKFCAMDYHLDWLNGALESAFLDKREGSLNEEESCKYRITGTQQDIDLLLAFETPGHRFYIVLVEAKGVSSFLPAQLESKLDRLDAIFFKNNQPRFDVEVHLVLAVPPEIQESVKSQWPENNKWKPKFIDLPIREDLLKITRTDDHGKPTKKDWKKWKIEKRPKLGKKEKADV
jgi:hypothetical protein